MLYICNKADDACVDARCAHAVAHDPEQFIPGLRECHALAYASRETLLADAVAKCADDCDRHPGAKCLPLPEWDYATLKEFAKGGTSGASIRI